MEIVAIAQRAEPIRALEEFVANAGAPFEGDYRDVGDFLQMEFLRVIAANDHGERVFKAERLGDFEMEAIGIDLFDAIVDGVRAVVLCSTLAVRTWRFIENGGLSRASGVSRSLPLTYRGRFLAGGRAPPLWTSY